jgi:hypothetical protein
VIRRLAAVAAADPDLIADLRQAAQQFLELTEPQLAEGPKTAQPDLGVASEQKTERRAVWSAAGGAFGWMWRRP